MKIIEIASNAKGNTDGIGKHGRIMANELRKRPEVESVTLLDGDTAGYSKFRMITSFEMSRVLDRARKQLEQDKTDVIIVEYPFAEYNPLLAVSYYRLHRSCVRNGCRLVLSLHEYDRVKSLRRYMIRFLLKCSDIVFVSEERYLHKLCKYNTNIKLRNIPHHLPCFQKEKTIDKNRFIYFGLVNRSKAFAEMLASWKHFNKNGTYYLDIITASEIDVDLQQYQNVSIYRNLSDKEAARKLERAAFGIVPVKPYIGLNNSSFVSCAQYGCTVIGMFERRLENCGFAIVLESYEEECFCKGLERAAGLREADIKNNSNKAIAFSRQFSTEGMVEQIMSQLLEKVRS